ncbi:DNA-directed RNA polymerase subunit delta [Lapidilactobacillus mulanensis]|uniref:Probable DNA-directed RNA polymerase subunit delta n=1 Tax=Lapidilactobacillus mulanensis TaxID=2485999 RepID=A0ABW4DP48_9LACO|nr:DNA-directed RNA polymerase subunit delta [Lapidilactobacillus mulanensis]
MQLEIFAGQKKSELSMIEVAHAILEEKGEAMSFADIVNQIQTYLGKSDIEIRARLGQFYTDLNEAGGFISLGENVWGLREWYPFDSVDEEVNHPEDDEETPRKKRRHKVNAFLADVSDDDDVIDYNDDDPEDDDSLAVGDTDDDDDTSDTSTVAPFKTPSISELDDSDDEDDTDELDDGIEGQLSEFNDDELVDTANADFSADDDDDSDDSDDFSDDDSSDDDDK